MREYNTEFNKIVKGKTFEEIMQEINSKVNKVLVRPFECKASDESCKNKWLFGKFSIHTMFVKTVLILRLEEFQNSSNQTESECEKAHVLELMEVGLGKLNKANIDLINNSSYFGEKAKKLTELNVRLHSECNAAYEYVNNQTRSKELSSESMGKYKKLEEFHIDLGSGIERAYIRIKNEQMGFDAETKIIIDLIPKIQELRTHLKEQTENVELLGELAACF